MNPRNGIDPNLAARTGGLTIGELLVAQAHRCPARIAVVDGERSGVAQIHVFDDGDNSIAVFQGAGAGLGASHARAASDSTAGPSSASRPPA